MRSFRRRHQINRHPCSTAKSLFSRSQQTACDWFNAIARRAAIAGDPSAIHKMRIELTKLRAMVRFFSPMMNDEAWPRLKKELRWLNSKFLERHATMMSR